MIEFQSSSATKSLSNQAIPVDQRHPVVLCACDENYVRPLAVTLYSAATNLAADRSLTVYLLDGGISEQSAMMLKETLANLPVNLIMIRPDAQCVADLSTSHHISHTAYYRLLAARLLPSSIEKVIYLDCDLIVHGDISQLWDTDIGEQSCLAVQDIACPYIDAKSGCQNYRLSCPYMASCNPIPNWKKLKLDGRRPYFNSGVMVLNLETWRKCDVADDLLKCLRDNQRYVWCWDQYALNVVFSESWGQLPLTWNQGAHAFEYPSLRHSPVESEGFTQMLQTPSITHFTTEFKPWCRRCAHPDKNSFFEILDQTAWSQWRPVHQPSLKAWYQDRAVNTHLRLMRWKRRLASLFS